MTWIHISGSIFPYLFSWVIYQEQLVTDLLNWAGLVVNGLIAFVFPIILCYYVFVMHHSNLQTNNRQGNPASPYRRYRTKNRNDIEMTNVDENLVIIETDSDSNEPDTHEALSSFLLPYRPIIISAIFIMFLTMITTTIIMNIREAM